MAMSDFTAFELFSEPMIAIKSNDKIFYMNSAAKKLFGEKYMKTDAKDIFGKKFFEASGDITSGSFIFGKKSYIGSVIKINGFRTIVIRNTKTASELKAESEKAHIGAVLNTFLMVTGNTLSQINSVKNKKFKVTEDDLRQKVAIAENASFAALRLIDHIRFLTSEIDEGGLYIDNFDIYQRLADVTTVSSHLTDYAGIRISFVAPKQESSFRGDEKYIIMMLLNLISNSIKHTPKGGRITVIVNQIEKGLFEVTVEDTGEGISGDKQPYLFIPFEARDSGEYFDGAGLGLAVVKKVAELHNGNVYISTSENGTAVKVTLRSFKRSDVVLECPKPKEYGDPNRIVYLELSDALNIKDYIRIYRPNI